MPAERILKSKAIQAARKKIKVLPDRHLNENLDWAADSFADAYNIGKQEAQAEIIGRLQALKP